MNKMRILISVFALPFAMANFTIGQPSYLVSGTVAMSDCPMMASQHDTHSQHHAEMNQRGDQAMGFSQEKTTHHFRLFTDGGAIEVRANDAKDAENVRQVRAHLGHIARMFADGNFSIPMLVHNETPPGAK